MHDRAIRSPDFKPVQLGKRRPDSPGSCGSQFPRLESLLHTKQTHCKNVHCNSEHVLTLFPIAVCSHGEHHQESRLPCHTNTKQRMYMKKSYRHRCINYNHRGSCEPFWFCTCTWTCCTSEAGASQHQPHSARQLACPAPPAVM